MGPEENKGEDKTKILVLGYSRVVEHLLSTHKTLGSSLSLEGHGGWVELLPLLWFRGRFRNGEGCYIHCTQEP